VALFEIPDSRDERVNVLARIVECKRRPNSALHSESPKDWLRTMMAGAHRDALPI
jgi:hypothetical protein